MGVLRNLNKEQLKEIAISLRLVGIGQLVYFGYKGFSDGKVWNLVFSIPLMAFLIFIAIYVLAFADD